MQRLLFTRSYTVRMEIKEEKGYFCKEGDHLNMFLGKISPNVLEETGVEAKLGDVSLGNEKISLDKGKNFLRLGQLRDLNSNGLLRRVPGNQVEA